MSQDTKVHHYRGVLCGYCRQPIPLPGIIDRLAGREDDSTAPPRERGAHVFNLRCRACEKEKPYRPKDITEFEGTPRPRFSRSRTAEPTQHQRPIARAANG